MSKTWFLTLVLQNNILCFLLPFFFWVQSKKRVAYYTQARIIHGRTLYLGKYGRWSSRRVDPAWKFALFSSLGVVHPWLVQPLFWPWVSILSSLFVGFWQTLFSFWGLSLKLSMHTTCEIQCRVYSTSFQVTRSSYSVSDIDKGKKFVK